MNLKSHVKVVSIFISLLFFAFCAIPTATMAATIYVDSVDGNDTTGNGSEGTPYKTFHKAYTVASANDTIDLSGTFTWSDAAETGDVTSSGYSISKNLTIQGQGADTTIIQAGTSSTTPDRKVLTIGSGYNVIIRDLAIRNGRVTSSVNGGGIENSGSTTIERVHVYDNYTGGYGGGISNTGFLYIKDSTINNNYAGSQGGGINSSYTAGNSNVTVIINTTIAYNRQAASIATVGGAGIFIRSGTVTIIGSTVAYNDNINSGTARGVGLQTDGGTATISNSLFILNKAGGTNVIALTSQYLDIYQSSGTITDAGGNIFGKTLNVTYDNSSWYDNKTGSGVGDSVFTNQGTSATGTVSLSTTLAQNDSLNKTPTFAITGATSLTINNGDTTGVGAYAIPSTDQRGAYRSGANDVGAYEYSGSFTDIVAPTISAIATSTATSTATITWTTNESATSTVQYGLTDSYGSSSSTNSSVASHAYSLTGLTPDTTYHFQIEVADASGNSATSSDLTFTTDALPDEDAPSFSSVATSTTATSATISWETDEPATSILTYSPGPIYRSATSTAIATTSHQFILSNLASCARFNFKISGVDSSSNSATSSAYSFMTTGCTGNASIHTSEITEVSVAQGGTISLNHMSLAIPAGFTSGVASTSFQINRLDETTFFAGAGVPSGKTRSDVPVFSLKSMRDATTTVSSFDDDIEVVMTYDDGEVSDLLESSLWVYRHDGSSWNALSDCVVNTVANTVTCTTTQFSDFSLFGDGAPVVSGASDVSTNGARTGAGSSIYYGCKDSKASNYESYSAHMQSMCTYSNINSVSIGYLLATQDTTQPIVAAVLDTPKKVRDFGYGAKGDDVKALQQILIDKGYSIPAGATGIFFGQTRSALKQYQIDTNIKPAAGYFGPITRSRIELEK